MENKRRCVICGEQFKPRSHNSIVCSEKCRKVRIVQMRWKNIDRYRERAEKYRRLNRTKINQRARKRYWKNRGKLLERAAAYRHKNKERLNKNHREYYKQNKDKLIEYSKEYRRNHYTQTREATRQYQIKNKTLINIKRRRKSRELYHNNIDFKLRTLIRNRINRIIKRNQRQGSAIRDLGCSVNHLKKYLEAKFLEGMTWDNWKLKGWHIDHIKPLCSFDLTDRDQFKKAVHYTNLQPLWWRDNLLKRYYNEEN